MKAWATPVEVVPAEAVAGVRARWEELTRRHGPLVRLLEPGAGLFEGEESVGVAPALAPVVQELPGLALGAVEIRWPQGKSQHWPELGELSRFEFQPVWEVGREAGVVLIDPVSGRAGQVVHVRGDSDLESVDVLAPDVVSWLEAFTAWAEQDLVALVRELGEATDDEEERELMFEEAIGQDFDSWLDQSVTARAVRLGRSSGTAADPQ